MNTIDSFSPAEASLPRRSISAAKAERVEQADFQQAMQTSSAQLITEKNVSEIAIRMDFLGLEYRRVDSTERRYNTSTDARHVQQQGTAKKEEGAVLDVDAEGTDPGAGDATRKVQRAYLQHEKPNDPIRYLA